MTPMLNNQSNNFKNKKINKLPFVGREKEILECLNFMNMSIDNSLSRGLVISGISGVGKTYFCKELLFKFNKETPNSFCLYMDFVSDDFTTTMLFQSLIYLSQYPIRSNRNNPINIEKNVTFKKFIETKSLNKIAIERFYSLIKNSIDLLPKSIESFEDSIDKPNHIQNFHSLHIEPSSIFFEYLKFLTEKQFIVLAFDNYQYISESLRLLIESNIIRFKRNICLIVISKIENNINIVNNLRCYSNNLKYLNIEPFSLKKTFMLMRTIFPQKNNNEIEKIARDSFIKGKGNPKEIEHYIIHYFNNLKKNLSYSDIETFIDTIGNMPLFQKYILTIAALFPSGLQIDYVIKILEKFLSTNQKKYIYDSINELVMLGYLVINNTSGKILRYKHEKIKTIIKTIKEEKFIEFQDIILNTLEEIISKRTKEYLYLLHCFVGILSNGQILIKLDYIVDLLNIQYRNNNYHYICERYDILLKIIDFLPESTILAFLDSFQKTSEFTKGEVVLNILENKKTNINDQFRLYKVKYYTQTYKYNEALTILNNIVTDNLSINEILFYKINILQYLYNNEEAKKLVDTMLHINREKKSLFYYITLRNSAHYFSFEKACQNLKDVLSYFQQKNFEFGIATTFNNLGVIYLWNYEIKKSIDILLKAKFIMENINSNEIYQPLWNLGVAEALSNNYQTAIAYFEESCTWIHRNLELDYILNRINFFIVKIAAMKMTPIDVINELYDLYKNSKTINNPRMHYQITYNLLALQKIVDINIQISPDKNYWDYIAGIKERKYTGLEVLKTIKIGENNLTFLFILSPHWRY
jgi:Cdc6-like AAA superfamily ATPase